MNIHNQLHQQFVPARRIAGLIALLAALSLVTAACSSAEDSASDSPEPTTVATTPDAQDDEPADSDKADDEAAGNDNADDSQTDTTPSDAPLELGRGVTDDTITIGYTYLNLDDLREQGIIDINHGPIPEHLQTMVEHVNATGGVHGRTLQVVTSAFDPIDANSQQAACIELTEDLEVFAVLGAVRGDNVLCYTEQHDTIAITQAGLTQERLERSNAPYATVNVSRETNIEAFVNDGVTRGLFDGLTVAVHSTDATKVAEDIAIPALRAAGVDIAFESLVQGDGTVGGASAAVAVNIESMRARNIDAVFVVGDALVAVNAFIGEGYFPTLFFTDQGSAQGAAVRADLSVFQDVYAFGGFNDITRFEEPTFRAECAAIWDAAHPGDPVIHPNDVPDGEPNHVVGLGNVCRVLTIFVVVAEAAGPNLNNDTFGAAMDQLSEFQLPGMGPASLAPGKRGAQDDLRLWTYDPDTAESDSGFVEIP